MEDQEHSNSFQEQRTRDELNQLLHHGHAIPVSKGMTTSFVDEHYPDWTWDGLMDVFRSAGILVSQGGGPPKCDDRVEVFYFNGTDSWLVQWVDGSATKSR